MSFQAWPDKDPDAILDYVINWASWMATSDVITTSTWVIVLPDGDAHPLIKDSDTISVDGQVTQIWLRGGTVGTKYTLTNHIRTQDSREDDRSVTVKIKQK